jgi:hypothetical protein
VATPGKGAWRPHLILLNKKRTALSGLPSRAP